MMGSDPKVCIISNIAWKFSTAMARKFMMVTVAETNGMAGLRKRNVPMVFMAISYMHGIYLAKNLFFRVQYTYFVNRNGRFVKNAAMQPYTKRTD